MTIPATGVEALTIHDVEERLEAWIRSVFRISSSDPAFDRSVDLFDRGYVDSIGLAELLEFIHQEFDVEVPEDDLLSDEFATIEDMSRVILRHGGR